MSFLGLAEYDSISCQLTLNKYDLNKDGIFSGNEVTEEQKQAMQNLINDTGRNLVFITGFLFSLAISCSIYFLGIISSKLQKTMAK